MTTSWWRQRSARLLLQKGITNFDARLPSSCAGIAFHSRIIGQLHGPLDHPAATPTQSAAAIRILLRSTAADISRRHDPTDLDAARDACALHLHQPRPIPAYPDVLVTATLDLTLGSTDREATQLLMAERQQQAVEAAVQRQRHQVLRDMLSDPTLAVLWWLDTHADALTGFSKPDQLRDLLTRLREISEHLRQLPPSTDTPLEQQLLELLRTFVSSFTEDHQKLMLMSIMALGFSQTGHPHLVASIEHLIHTRFPQSPPTDHPHAPTNAPHTSAESSSNGQRWQ